MLLRQLSQACKHVNGHSMGGGGVHRHIRQHTCTGTHEYSDAQQCSHKDMRAHIHTRMPLNAHACSDFTQEQERVERERVVRRKVAASTFARGYLSGIVSSVFDGLQQSGFFYDPVSAQRSSACSHARAGSSILRPRGERVPHSSVISMPCLECLLHLLPAVSGRHMACTPCPIISPDALLALL